MSLKTDHLKKCLVTLEAALRQLKQAPVGSVEYDIYRNAVIKGDVPAAVKRSGWMVVYKDCFQGLVV
jgi:hypothetical protein